TCALPICAPALLAQLGPTPESDGPVGAQHDPETAHGRALLESSTPSRSRKAAPSKRQYRVDGSFASLFFSNLRNERSSVAHALTMRQSRAPVGRMCLRLHNVKKC